jgi:hypothetical protein
MIQCWALQSCRSGFDMYLWQAQIYCHKANHTTDTTMHNAANYDDSHFLERMPYRKVREIKCVPLPYDIYILSYISLFFCMIRCSEEK